MNTFLALPCICVLLIIIVLRVLLSGSHLWTCFYVCMQAYVKVCVRVQFHLKQNAKLEIACRCAQHNVHNKMKLKIYTSFKTWKKKKNHWNEKGKNTIKIVSECVRVRCVVHSYLSRCVHCYILVGIHTHFSECCLPHTIQTHNASAYFAAVNRISWMLMLFEAFNFFKRTKQRVWIWERENNGFVRHSHTHASGEASELSKKK